MAISLGRHKQYGAKVTESKRLAKEYARQQKRAKKRGFFSSILGSAGGKLLGGALTGFLGLTGLGAPLGMALGNIIAKQGAQALTKGMGADTSKIAAKSKYGYGKGEAKTLREGLEEQISASQDVDFGRELLGSYVSAGASGALKGTLKGLGKPGAFIKEGGPKSFAERMTAGSEGLQEAWGDTLTWGGDPEDVPAEQLIDEGAIDTLGDIGQSYEIPEGMDIGQSYEVPEGMEQGGLIPKYNIGGMVQAQSPTIANYFGMQGVSLGGSNKQSVAEMLGRK